MKRETPTTVKTRLAGVLGLSKPPMGRTIPMVKEKMDRTIAVQRFDAGVTSLSIMGHKDDLDPFRYLALCCNFASKLVALCYWLCSYHCGHCHSKKHKHRGYNVKTL